MDDLSRCEAPVLSLCAESLARLSHGWAWPSGDRASASAWGAPYATLTAQSAGPRMAHLDGRDVEVREGEER
jgi:hypothetical protein